MASLPAAPEAMGRQGRLSQEQLQRIRRRHRGYVIVLVTISLLLLLQPVAQRWPLLNPLGAIVLSLVMMLFLTRYSPLRARKPLFYGLGIAAIGSELLWLVGLETGSGLAIHLGIAHLLVWSLFIGVFLLRKVRALMLEPYVTQAVVMGAASGYLMIGYLGAFLLHTLLIWQPAAFSISRLAPGIDPVRAPLHAFPSMVMASFGALTTTGADIGRPGSVLASTGCLAITILGQLYVAVLIALILGRFHRRGV
jgi:hypothetical protein